MSYFNNFTPIEYDFDGNGTNKTIKNKIWRAICISFNEYVKKY